MHYLWKGVLLLAWGVLFASCGGSSQSINTLPTVRPANVSCNAPEAPASAANVQIVNAFPDLPAIPELTKIIMEPGVANPRWFALSKSGQISVFDPSDATRIQTYLSFSVNSASEGGLLSLAFHPDYPSVPELFVSYTRDGLNGNELLSVISRITLDNIDSPGAISVGSTEQVLLSVDQFAANHNAGDLAFGSDRLLYIGFGDGGGGGDPQETAQDNTRLLGAFLRINVLGTGSDYEIPGQNPFAGNPKCGPGVNAAACPEIFAWGFRNPWRWSFDDVASVMWVADVGQGAREEVNQVVLGGNYGWDCREGLIPFELEGCDEAYRDPVYDYNRDDGDRSVTGGYVYRGAAITSLIGNYIFGDFTSGRLWALQADAGGGYNRLNLGEVSPNSITAFGVDDAGELYFTHFLEGIIYKILPGEDASQNSVLPNTNSVATVATELSATGCTDPNDITQAYSGLIPYEPIAKFWSDSASKDRFIALPEGEAMSIDADDNLVFPTGTILIKSFRLNNRLVETRHLVHHPNGSWGAYTYEWNAAQTEATRVDGGKRVTIEGQTWIYPSTSECFQCHTTQAGIGLGTEVAQLNHSYTYPGSGLAANQLETFSELGLLETVFNGSGESLPLLVDPKDHTQSLSKRARAYLHTNCAQCHLPEGPTQSDLDLRYSTLLRDTNSCDASPQLGDLGLNNPKIVSPGNAENSVLLARMSLRDTNAMPLIGTAQVDTEGVALIRAWINSLAGC